MYAEESERELSNENGMPKQLSKQEWARICVRAQVIFGNKSNWINGFGMSCDTDESGLWNERQQTNERGTQLVAVSEFAGRKDRELLC